LATPLAATRSPTTQDSLARETTGSQTLLEHHPLEHRLAPWYPRAAIPHQSSKLHNEHDQTNSSIVVLECQRKCGHCGADVNAGSKGAVGLCSSSTMRWWGWRETRCEEAAAGRSKACRHHRVPKYPSHTPGTWTCTAFWGPLGTWCCMWRGGGQESNWSARDKEACAWMLRTCDEVQGQVMCCTAHALPSSSPPH